MNENSNSIVRLCGVLVRGNPHMILYKTRFLYTRSIFYIAVILLN